jgi:hypothetical protein
MSDCINLRERFGHYRIEYDPAHHGRSDDPWLQIIPCRYGHIYPYGGDKLGVATSRKIGLQLARLPGVEVWQDGDDGINLVFPHDLLPDVAKIVKPRRKRKLDAAARKRASEQGTVNLARHRLAKAQSDFLSEIPAQAG